MVKVTGFSNPGKQNLRSCGFATLHLLFAKVAKSAVWTSTHGATNVLNPPLEADTALRIDVCNGLRAVLRRILVSVCSLALSRLSRWKFVVLVLSDRFRQHRTFDKKWRVTELRTKPPDAIAAHFVELDGSGTQ